MASADVVTHATETRTPLVVDVDGTLLKSDLLAEGLVALLVRRPARLAGAFGAYWKRGRGGLKTYVARYAELDVTTVPVCADVVALMETARAAGQPIVLATGAHRSYARRLAEVHNADRFLATTARRNLTGHRKLAALQAEYPAFDYVGNHTVDLPIWSKARRPIAANASAGCVRRLRADRANAEQIAPRGSGVRAFVRAIRPHQWAKNALIFLPALAAHTWTWTLLLAFAAFSATASAIYLFNDLADLKHDRVHPVKRFRPLAAGDLSIPAGLFGMMALLAIGAAAAATLPLKFIAWLVVYACLSLSYSFFLKRRLLVDVLTLALLYTIRVLAGGAAAQVPLSRWFVAFSIFLFFALAIVKRVGELRLLGEASGDKASSGRAYRAEDLFPMLALGVAASAATTLVYCLYVTSDDVLSLYRHPDFLWVGLPVLLYWQARLWVFANRGALHSDPVVFALKDHVSWAAMLCAALGVALATISL